MGIFRTKKASRHSVAECRRNENRLHGLILRTDGHQLPALLHEWAEWRECRARLENKNEAPPPAKADECEFCGLGNVIVEANGRREYRPCPVCAARMAAARAEQENDGPAREVEKCDESQPEFRGSCFIYSDASDAVDAVRIASEDFAPENRAGFLRSVADQLADLRAEADANGTESDA